MRVYVIVHTEMKHKQRLNMMNEENALFADGVSGMEITIAYDLMRRLCDISRDYYCSYGTARDLRWRECGTLGKIALYAA